jgi:hypothetical protein
MDFYGMSSNIYYDKLIQCSSYSGTIAAYEAQTGKLLWTYNATGPAFESPYGDNMPLSIWAVCDGKIYTYSSEHSPSKPLWRASYMRCIDINDGKELWKLLYYNGFTGGPSLANGYIVSASDYDNLIYCIGKGPSATTVTGPQIVAPQGTAVFISGTVTDQSPGAKALEQKMGYLSGVPAISDADQQAWMEYLYEQQAMPAKATGVKVHLTAIDPNGNFQVIGDATSDIGGTYGIAWTPPVPGTYQVTATFDGSKSYGSSYATTHFAVGEPSAKPAVVTPIPAALPTALPTQPTQIPEQTPTASPSEAVTPPTSAEPTTTYIAIGVAVIVIVVAASALVLRARKRK